MVSIRELSTAMFGAWRFATLDRSAIQFFDNTPEAFWRSFNAALIALPAYSLLVLLSFAEHPVDANPIRILFTELIAYIIGWVFFPLVMVAFTDAAKCADNYFRFIAAWNWSIVLQAFLFLAVSAFVASGSVPDGLGAMISLTAMLAIFLYQGFIAHATLNIPAPTAAVVVVIDLGIAIGLSFISRSFYLSGT